MAITKLPKSGVGASAVTADKIADGVIVAGDFPDCAIASDRIADDAITNAKLSNSAITIRGTSTSLGGSITLSPDVNWQAKVTSDGSTVTTMVAGQGYFVDNSSAAGLVKLPASAARGDTVIIKDYAGNFGTNNLTIQRNGHNIQGVASNATLSTNRKSVTLVYVDSTKGWLYTDEHDVSDLQKEIFISATGGTITTSGNYKIHTFTGDGNFVVASVGGGATPCAVATKVDYVVVAGGAGAAFLQAGGGGAGGFREGKDSTASSPHTASPLAASSGITVSASPGTYPITVGGGGAGKTTPGGRGASGSNSVFSTITSAGGGGGGGSGAGGDPPGCLAGGSGGGGGENNNGGAGNTPPVSPSQGNNGGNGNVPHISGGGGGGAGAAGSPSPGNKFGGPGGNGVASSITGSSVTRAGGGGGGGGGCGSGAGGTGGGGAGHPCGPGHSTGGNPGTANTGGGGGSNGFPLTPGTAGGSGGSGVVILRYKYQSG